MFNLLFAITAGSAIFLAFLVVTVRSGTNTVANRWLGVYLLLLGLFMLDDGLLVFGIYKEHPHLFGVLNLPLFALSPAMYLAVSQFVAVERRFRLKELWHFLPLVLYTLLSLPFLLSTAEVKLKELDSTTELAPYGDTIFMTVLVTQVLGYLFASFRKLRKHHKNIENISSSPSEVNLDWLVYFLYAIGGMVVIWFLEMFAIPYQQGARWYTVAYSVAIYCLGYFALRQKEVYPFSEKEAEELGEIMEAAENPPAARRQLFSEEKLNALKIHLLETMKNQKPFIDPELNLPTLARRLSLNVHETSELINTGFGENFAQFITRHRIEESKKLLLSEKHAHLSMVGIAFESGFNSKTAFNTAFKKMVGTTPSEFQKQTNSMA